MSETQVAPRLRHFIRHKALKKILSFGDTQITKLQKQGRFPKSFRMPGGRDRIYDADEITAFQEKLLADRDAGLLENFFVTGAVAEHVAAREATPSATAVTKIATGKRTSKAKQRLKTKET